MSEEMKKEKYKLIIKQIDSINSKTGDLFSKLSNLKSNVEKNIALDNLVFQEKKINDCINNLNSVKDSLKQVKYRLSKKI